jgi:hypothetical protein
MKNIADSPADSLPALPTGRQAAGRGDESRK